MCVHAMIPFSVVLINVHVLEPLDSDALGHEFLDPIVLLHEHHALATEKSIWKEEISVNLNDKMLMLYSKPCNESLLIQRFSVLFRYAAFLVAFLRPSVLTLLWKVKSKYNYFFKFVQIWRLISTTYSPNCWQQVARTKTKIDGPVWICPRWASVNEPNKKKQEA